MLFHVPPAVIVTAPVKVYVPTLEVMFKIPVEPPPTVVAPVAVKLNPAMFSVVPSPIDTVPLTAIPTTVVVVTEPESARFPLMVVVPVCSTSVPEPDKFK